MKLPFLKASFIQTKMFKKAESFKHQRLIPIVEASIQEMNV
jgi:hypothetical protein